METAVDRLCSAAALLKLVGQSPAFLQAIQPLPRMAQSDAAVLISGETGTGKELAARALHYLSPRASGPFIAVNCGALAETLVEDELFGHERGAFTDARERREGLVAQADQGTLFLDEVDSLTCKGQVCLLRLMQEQRYRPLGACAERQANVRVVTAANIPLEPRVHTGAFRADLYYRVAVFCLNLPPLRQRRDDVLLLAEHFMHKHAPLDRPRARFSDGAVEALLRHSWPGNVRELENAVLRACHLGQGPLLEASDLGLEIGTLPAEGDSFQDNKRRALAAFEVAFLVRLMARHHGNVSRAAVAAGKDRRDLGRLLRKHGIAPVAFRG